MKKTIKTIMIMVIVALMSTMTVIPAKAEGFDFQTAISAFEENSFNSKILKVGEIDDYPDGGVFADYADTELYVSDEKVVKIDSNGIVTAVGEGTAYVAIVPRDINYHITRYTVSNANTTPENEDGENNTNNDKQKTHSDLFDDLSEQTESSGIFSFMSGSFSIFGIFFVAVLTIIILVWILVISSIRKSKRLDKVMREILANPCQETAEAAVMEFSKINTFVRWNLSSGGDSRGVHFTMWREVFNNTVNPSPQIKNETKEALRKALISINVYGLNNVVQVYSQAEINEMRENFGMGGEENVWHNLKSLSGCDVYRNVKIRNEATASEIDAVIVDPNHGIFLVEVKSVGGKKMSDGHKYISYADLTEDPTNQIFRHQNDFIEYIADVNISSKIKNVLVFSWPKGSDRRFINKNTFPATPYEIITVEQLLGHCISQPMVGITENERLKIAEKLRDCSNDHIIR